MTAPFHPGELEAQALAGGGPGGAGIRDFMPDQHRTFFALLPMIFAAFSDDEGRPVATVLTGTPGFVASPDERTLRIDALPLAGDPAFGELAPGAAIGLLGLQFETRRRNRANGVVRSVDATGLTVDVRQSFGNCAKYIQTRKIRPASSGPGAVVRRSGLDTAAAEIVRSADTFFVASRSGAAAGRNGGLDISHRGGRPGFVRIDGDRLTVPDFRGNRYFNTLGNLLDDPRVGLLFVEFETGDLVHISGTARVDWAPAAAPAGAERLWQVEVEETVVRPAALALRGFFHEFAPTTLQTSVW